MTAPQPDPQALPTHLSFKPDPPNPESGEFPSLDLLNANMRLFVLHYVLGDDEVRGNGYKSYLAAGYNAKNLNTASAASYQLLRLDKIRRAIKEIRSSMDEEFKIRMGSWASAAFKAKDLIERTIDTALDPKLAEDKQVRPTANQLFAAREALDRYFGRPKQPHELGATGSLEELIKNLNARARIDSRPNSPRLGPGDPNFIGSVPPVTREIEDAPGEADGSAG